MNLGRHRTLVFTGALLLTMPAGLLAQSSGSVEAAGTTAVASVSTDAVPSLEELGLPGAAQTSGQSGAASQDQTQENQKQNPAAGTTPSLSDLGFSTSQTQGSAQEQARLNKRTHMLKVHQTLGLITLIPMVATVVAGGGAKFKKGPIPGTFVPPSSTSLDLHVALGATTGAMYAATAYYAIFAPKIPGVKRRGAIRVHKYLEYVHGPGMVLTGVLGILAYNQESSGQKVHGIASAHAPVADITVAAYAASIVAVSWPIKLKFWEER
jgi:hypothetical protein